MGGRLEQVTDAALDRYLRDQKLRNLRPRSIERMGDTLRSLVRFHGRPLLELSRDDIEAWLVGAPQDPRGPRGPRTRYNLISGAASFYDWAILEGFIDVNPTQRIRRPKLRRTLPRPIPHDDLAHAVRQAPSEIRAWLLLAALGGLRCQEIAGLHREHIWDHEDPAVLFVAEAKGGGERIVPLHPDVLAALRVFGLPASGPLFWNTVGKPQSPMRVSQIGNAYLRSVGVRATMHQLRHRFGTDIYALSGDLRLTQEALGHASPATTAIYTQINPARTVAVVHRLRIAGSGQSDSFASSKS